MAKHGPDEGWRQHVLNTVLPTMEAAAVTAPAITGLTPGPADGMPVNVGFVALQPNFDVIEALPETRKDLLRKLRQHRDDARAIIPEFERVREASLRRIEDANALKRLIDHPQHGGFNLADDNHSVVTAKRTLEKSTDDFERLKKSREDREGAYQSASGALANVEAWLKTGMPGGTVLVDYEGEAPKLNKGEGILDGIERLRRRCRELKADLHRIASAPYPSSHAKQRMRGMIEALAQRGQPDVSRLIEHDGEIVWPTKRVKVEVHNAQPGAIGFAEIPDMLAIDAWRNKEATIAKLDAEINTESDDPASLSHEARQKAEAETMGDLLAVEREEAALTWQAQAQGLSCEHRGDCSPLAILQVQLITVPRAPSGPSSPGHSYDILQPGGGRR